MTTDEVLQHAQRLCERLHATKGVSNYSTGIMAGMEAEIADFLRTAAGAQSAFYANAVALRGNPDFRVHNGLSSVLAGFIDFVKAGLQTGVSPERQAQLDVVSDFLDQANTLLSTRGVHPAAPAVLVGASLEEFLRTWVENVPLSLGNRKPSLQSYAHVLAEEGLITKQDVKDITSWGGTRKHAAHGEWAEVGDTNRVRLMLEGVNLFMRRYGA